MWCAMLGFLFFFSSFPFGYGDWGMAVAIDREKRWCLQVGIVSMVKWEVLF